MFIPLKEMPKEERPRERLLRLGPEQLTNVELIAILLGTGTRNLSVLELAQRLLHHCEAKDRGNGLRYLMRMRQDELKKVVPGLGPAKLCQLLASLQLGQRAAAPQLRRVSLNNPRAVFEYLRLRIGQKNREHFVVVLLNAKNYVIHDEVISVGTLTTSLVHPREIFQEAIRRSAHAIILAHNHPSGDPTPSREDREVTQRLVEAGKLLGIHVLDHLIIGDGGYTSFRERGLLE